MRLSTPLVALLITLPISANAENFGKVVFNNINDTAYSTEGYWTGYEPTIDKVTIVGLQFRTQNAGYISSIALSAFGNETTSVAIYSDNNGKIGKLIDTLALVGGKRYGGFAIGEFKTGTQLVAKTTYWVAISQNGESWYNEEQDDPSKIIYSQNEGNTIDLDQPSFQEYSKNGKLGLRLCITSVENTTPSDCPDNQSLRETTAAQRNFEELNHPKTNKAKRKKVKSLPSSDIQGQDQ